MARLAWLGLGNSKPEARATANQQDGLAWLDEAVAWLAWLLSLSQGQGNTSSYNSTTVGSYTSGTSAWSLVMLDLLLDNSVMQYEAITSRYLCHILDWCPTSVLLMMNNWNNESLRL
jgi:hypothetical protein